MGAQRYRNGVGVSRTEVRAVVTENGRQGARGCVNPCAVFNALRGCAVRELISNERIDVAGSGVTPN